MKTSISRIVVMLTIMSLLAGCSKPRKTQVADVPNDSVPAKKKGKANGLVKAYSADGKLSTAVTYKDGIRDGISYAYFPNGQVNLEMTYANGKREGQSKRYYESGKLYQTTEYKDNDLHGFQMKYRENGEKISTAKFERDEPCSGLKEYLLDGSVKKDYPSIVVTVKDELKTKGRYVLQMAMSNKTKRVKFYEGRLTPSGCLHGGLNFIRLNESTGVGEIIYTLPPNGFLMQELNIIAAVKTTQGNTYIAQTVFNLSIEN